MLVKKLQEMQRHLYSQICVAFLLGVYLECVFHINTQKQNWPFHSLLSVYVHYHLFGVVWQTYVVYPNIFFVSNSFPVGCTSDHQWGTPPRAPLSLRGVRLPRPSHPTNTPAWVPHPTEPGGRVLRRTRGILGVSPTCTTCRDPYLLLSVEGYVATAVCIVVTIASKSLSVL